MSYDPIVSSPLSFSGSAARLWRPVRRASGAGKAALGTLLVFVIACVWMFVACWYLMWGLLVVPWRLLRRGQRRDKAVRQYVESQAKPSQQPTPWR